MRALTLFATASLLLAGCETAFVGRAPAGLYQLVEVNGQAPPATSDPAGQCPETIEGGHLELDSIARRFELALQRRGPCIAAGQREVRESGSYLRRGGRLELETGSTAAPRTLVASETGRTISLGYGRLRLRFRQAAPQR